MTQNTNYKYTVLQKQSSYIVSSSDLVALLSDPDSRELCFNILDMVYLLTLLGNSETKEQDWLGPSPVVTGTLDLVVTLSLLALSTPYCEVS